MVAIASDVGNYQQLHVSAIMVAIIRLYILKQIN